MSPPGHSLATRQSIEATIRRREPPGDTTLPPGAASISMEALPYLTLSGPLGSDGGGDNPSADLSVHGVLGEGGMGKVLVGAQRSMQREVALKTLKDDAGIGHAAALISEGVISGQLEHPNIIPVHQLGRSREGKPLLVMKRVHGTSWLELLENPAHPAWDRLRALASDRLVANLEILMQVCQALDFAHSRGIAHLDVKPENVMVGDAGDVYLVDWGVATRFELPAERAVVGTPAYLAPELVDPALPLGPATDVFLLGATLHRVLTGRTRYQGTELNEVLRQAFTCAPLRYGAEVPVELAQLCVRACARTPAERVPSALEFRQALRDFLAHRGSLEATTAADLRLAELEAMSGRIGADPGELARRGTEARFGFAIALQQWPGNERARSGAVKTLELLVKLELSRENVDGARALLGELAIAPGGLALVAPLTAQLEALAAHRGAREREAQALRLQQQELDFTVSRRERLWFLLVMIMPGAVGTVAFMNSPAAPLLGETHLMVGVTAALLGLGLLALYLGRKALLRNAANRSFIGAFLGTLAIWGINRTLGVIDGDSVAHLVRGDLLSAAATTMVGGLMVQRSWLLASATAVVGAIVTSVFPAYALLTLPVASIALIGFLVFTRPPDGLSSFGLAK